MKAEGARGEPIISQQTACPTDEITYSTYPRNLRALGPPMPGIIVKRRILARTDDNFPGIYSRGLFTNDSDLDRL